MDAKKQLIDAAKKICLTDSAIAARLGVTRQMVSHWRKNRFPLAQGHVIALAKIAHEDPTKWLILVEAQQSEGTIHREWIKAAERLGIAASLIIFLGAVAAPAHAFSALSHYEQSSRYALCELVRHLITKVRETITPKPGIWNAARSTNYAASPMLA